MGMILVDFRVFEIISVSNSAVSTAEERWRS